MDINEAWKQIKSAHEKIDKPANSLFLSKLKSHNTLAQLKKNIGINILFGVVVCIFYLLIIIKFQIWQVQVGIGIVGLFSCWVIFSTYKLYQQINPVISSENSLLAEMKAQYTNVNKWMQTQKRVALFFYPISATAGFILGGVIGSGKSVNDFMSKPISIIALVVALLILVPACHQLSKWLFAISFGKQLKRLKENIDALDN